MLNSYTESSFQQICQFQFHSGWDPSINNKHINTRGKSLCLLTTGLAWESIFYGYGYTKKTSLVTSSRGMFLTKGKGTETSSFCIIWSTVAPRQTISTRLLSSHHHQAESLCATTHLHSPRSSAETRVRSGGLVLVSPVKRELSDNNGFEKRRLAKTFSSEERALRLLVESSSCSILS